MKNFSWLSDFNKAGIKDAVPKLTRIDEWSMDGDYVKDASNKRCGIEEDCSYKKGNKQHRCEFMEGCISNGCSNSFYYSSGIICSHPDCVKYAKEHKKELYEGVVD